MATPTSNNRASLLAGLRTGGVRSSSVAVPHTAAPNGAFAISRFPSQQHNPIFQEDDEYLDFHPRNVPMTAAVDGPNNRFAGQQAINPASPYAQQYNSSASAQAQMQMQMLQLEMMRIQALQNQQYQLAQAQMQQQMQQLQLQQAHGRERHVSGSPFANPPATAGPAATSFDPRTPSMRRPNQADQLRAQLGVRTMDSVPMTAALGGRFGGRIGVSPSSSNDDFDGFTTSATPTTTVISGGTSLGGTATPSPHSGPSKSDAVSSWRRGSASRIISSPSVKVTPPDESSPSTAPKYRPQPLRFSSAVSQPLPAVAVDTTDEDTDGETHSSQSSGDAASNSSPTTPRSSSSNDAPLSPREEASKRLFEGLGIGRPRSATPPQAEQVTKAQPPAVSVAAHRMATQPTRQPRGPPSGSDELGPKNFATRIRRKAIGGLGVLMGARERRETIEAF